MKDFLLVAIPFIAISTLLVNILYPGAIDKLSETFVKKSDYDKTVERLLAEHDKLFDPVGNFANHNDPYFFHKLDENSKTLAVMQIANLRREIYLHQMRKEERTEEGKSWTEEDQLRMDYLIHRLNMLIEKQMIQLRREATPLSRLFGKDDE